MTTMRTLMLLAAGLVATALGCGADVPEHPTWQNDVYPIMVARCIRCHNAQGDNGGGTRDPLYMPGTPVQGNFDHESFDDFQALDKSFFSQAGNEVADGSMPPLPAAKLADWQIQTIRNFVKDNDPPVQ
jgi:hypothetical protein